MLPYRLNWEKARLHIVRSIAYSERGKLQMSLHLLSFIIPFSHLVFDFFYTFSIIHTIFYLRSTFILLSLFLSFSFSLPCFTPLLHFPQAAKEPTIINLPLYCFWGERTRERGKGGGTWELQEKKKKRRRGGGISNLRARATGPNEQMDKMKGGERGSLGGAEDVTINENNLQFRS